MSRFKVALGATACLVASALVGTGSAQASTHDGGDGEQSRK